MYTYYRQDKSPTRGVHMKQWQVSNLDAAKYLGIIKFQDNSGEYHDFHIYQTPERLVFGGMANTGFIESGYLPIDPGSNTDIHLQELFEDLEVYYNDGERYCSAIICNQRM